MLVEVALLLLLLFLSAQHKIEFKTFSSFMNFTNDMPFEPLKQM